MLIVFGIMSFKYLIVSALPLASHHSEFMLTLPVQVHREPDENNLSVPANSTTLKFNGGKNDTLVIYNTYCMYAATMYMCASGQAVFDFELYLCLSRHPLSSIMYCEIDCAKGSVFCGALG